MKRSLVWFKTDLRLHDNETLVRAIENSDEIVPVYCFDESHYGTTAYGTKKTGNFRAKFLLESLIDLDNSLRKLQSGLVVVWGKPEVELPRLAIKYNAKQVYAKKEVAYEECLTQTRVEEALWNINCTLETFSTSTLYHAHDLPFTLKDIPDVFTTFRKRIERESDVRAVLHKPSVIKSPVLDSMQLPTYEKMGLTEPKSDQRAALSFAGGETAGIKRVHDYLFGTHSISTYKLTRNGMVGENYSSKFSAWLSLGCTSARSIYYLIKQYESEIESNESTYWLVFELLWRDYFRFMMKKHKQRFFMRNGISNQTRKANPHNPTVFEKWKLAQTGNDFVDAHMTELKNTGFMSNRGRQNVASYLCHDLKLDWRYGAAYFEEQLIDYDVCSNWGNWAYVAGVGNDPRENRVFNTQKQANDYDKEKTFRNLWLNQ